jgi:hypothetical protein
MKTLLPLAAYSLSMSCGFPISWGAKFQVDGNEYRFGAANIEHLGLLAKLRAAWPREPSRSWLLPYRDLVRSLTAGAVFAYAAQQTRDPVTRCLAVWLRGRRGGKIGSAAVAGLYRGGDACLRKAVVRALQRMHAWAALRRIQACEPDPRIRRLARQKGPRDYRSRMSDFISHVTPGPRSSASATFFEQEGLELDAALPPRSGLFFRTILERIRWLVRTGTIQTQRVKRPAQEPI